MELKFKTTDTEVCLRRETPLQQMPCGLGLNPNAWLLQGRYRRQDRRGVPQCVSPHRRATISSACPEEVVYVYLAGWCVCVCFE